MNKKLPNNSIIMGIDPGTNIMGFGVIKVIGKEIELIEMIEYKLSNKDDHSIKLSKIFNKTSELINLPGAKKTASDHAKSFFCILTGVL